MLQLLKLQKQVLPRLSHIRRPILIVQGNLDATVDASVPQLIYDQVSSAVKDIHWMKKSGHCVILDCELEEIVEITLKFLEKVQI